MILGFNGSLGRVRELPNRIHNAIDFDESATVFNTVDSADSFLDKESFGKGRTDLYSNIAS